MKKKTIFDICCIGLYVTSAALQIASIIIQHREKKKAIRETDEFVENTIIKLGKFMDDCQERTGFWYSFDGRKAFFAAMIDEVVEKFPNDYKKILSPITKTFDIDQDLIDHDVHDNNVYCDHAQDLDIYFRYIETLLAEET